LNSLCISIKIKGFSIMHDLAGFMK
jgi:hypothetical protein